MEEIPKRRETRDGQVNNKNTAMFRRREILFECMCKCTYTASMLRDTLDVRNTRGLPSPPDLHPYGLTREKKILSQCQQKERSPLMQGERDTAPVLAHSYNYSEGARAPARAAVFQAMVAVFVSLLTSTLREDIELRRLFLVNSEADLQEHISRKTCSVL